MKHHDRLSCEDLFRRLDDYMDRELSARETERVRQHLEACATCAAEYAFEESVLRNVRTRMRRIAAPPDLLDRVLARLAGNSGGDPAAS